MAVLVWDQLGERAYESGLDRGVLYLHEGAAVVWNGLTSIVEKFDRSTSPVYFDGMKIQDLVELGDFAADMKAYTYPDELMILEGLGKVRKGLFFGDQAPQTFSLSYRTRVGDDVSGDEAGYKIHIIYNVTAIPKDTSHDTSSDQASVAEFEWDITAVPEEISGYRPTAHIIIDTRDVDVLFLMDLEAKLYGTDLSDALLPPFPEMIAFITSFYRVRIDDNGDGTWTATESTPGFITMISDTEFEIDHVDATYLDGVTYEVSTTYDPL